MFEITVNVIVVPQLSLKMQADTELEPNKTKPSQAPSDEVDVD